MRKLLVTTAIGALAMVLGSSVAAAAEKVENVNVEAKHMVTTTTPTYGGMSITNISMSLEVSLDDVDLASVAGVAEAEKRINNAATTACEQIGHQFPNATPDNAECARVAARGPLAKIHKASLSAAAK